MLWRILAAALVGISSSVAVVGAQGPNDPEVAAQNRNVPQSEAFPSIAQELADASKSVVARLRFQGADALSVDSITVVEDRAHGRIGDPPLLSVTTLDHKGGTIYTHNAWDPRWVYAEDPLGGETLTIEPDADGTFVMPFDRRLTAVRIVDLQGDEDKELITADLTPAIRGYCENNLQDPDCVQIDLAVTTVWAVTPPETLPIGASTEVTIRTRSTNFGPYMATAPIVGRTATAPSGAAVTPTSSQQNLPDTDKDVAFEYDEVYAVTCMEAGNQVITFATEVASALGVEADLAPENNVHMLALPLNCAASASEGPDVSGPPTPGNKTPPKQVQGLPGPGSPSEGGSSQEGVPIGEGGRPRTDGPSAELSQTGADVWRYLAVGLWLTVAGAAALHLGKPRRGASPESRR